MRSWQKGLIFIGRILISLLFILSALDNIMDWQETEHGLNNILLDWQTYSSFSPFMQNIFTKILEWVPALLIFMICLQVVGGLLVFFGVKVRLGATLLILFLLPSTVLFHHFWFASGSQKEIELIFFLKNLAVGGGLLFILALGSDKSKSKCNPGTPNLPPAEDFHMKSKDPYK